MLNIVVPMAGAGSRFSNAGYSDPKPLIPVLGEPMIKRVIDNLRPTLSHRFIFICQEDHDKNYNLKEKLKEWSPGCEVILINGITEGAACTVLKARQFINNDHPLMIANSDQFISCNIDQYLAAIAPERKLDGLIMTMFSSDPKWSYVLFDNQGKVVKVVEKEVVSDEATVGIYNFSKGRYFVESADRMISENIRSKGEFYVAPCYDYLAERGAEIDVFNIGSEGKGMYGLGTPADLEYFISSRVL